MINTLLNFKIVPYDSTICKFLEENLVYDGTELWKAETYMKVSINLVVAAFLDNKIVGIACMSNTSRMKVFIKYQREGIDIAQCVVQPGVIAVGEIKCRIVSKVPGGSYYIFPEIPVSMIALNNYNGRPARVPENGVG